MTRNPKIYQALRLFLTGFLTLTSGGHAWGADVLTLEDYLGRVQSTDLETQARTQEWRAYDFSSSQGVLSVAPEIYTRIQALSTEEKSFESSLTTDSLKSYEGVMGIRQKSIIGLDLDLHLKASKVDLENPRLGGVALGFDESSSAKFEVSLRQALWADGFGRTSRARRDLLTEQARARKYQAQASLEQRNLLAKNLYWKASGLKDLWKVRLKAVEDARSLAAWTSDRSKRNLIDQADELQARANLQVRELELAQATLQMKMNAREFNTLLGIDSDEISFQLQPISSYQRISDIPKGASTSGKAQASEAASQKAAAVLEAEAFRPRLDLVGGFSSSAQRSSTQPAIRESLSGQDYGFSVGVEFSMPLWFGARSRAVQGGLWKAEAADKLARQAKIEDERNWEILKQKQASVSQQAQTARLLEKTQQLKLERERGRLKQGRSTTFQVLSFEQDFANIQTQRIQLELSLIEIEANLDLYHRMENN